MKLSEMVETLAEELKVAGDREIGEACDERTGKWFCGLLLHYQWLARQQVIDPMDSHNCDLVGRQGAD